MTIMSKPSGAPATSLTYITIGALLAIWSSVWYFVGTPSSTLGRGVCMGMFLTGLVLAAIGFTVGQIGRSARTAELPPSEVTHQVAREDQLAAANGAGYPAAPAAQAPPVASYPVPPLPQNSAAPTGATVIQTG